MKSPKTSNSIKKPKTIKQEYTVNPEQGLLES